jgi:hypothetical protein
MNIFSRLFGRSKHTPVQVIETKPEGCEHDWVTIETGPHIRPIWFSYYGGCVSKGPWQRRGDSVGTIGGFEFSRRSVCLNCGECIDTIEEAEREVVELEAEALRRKELAAKMWEDCKGAE